MGIHPDPGGLNFLVQYIKSSSSVGFVMPNSGLLESTSTKSDTRFTAGALSKSNIT